MAKKKKEVDKGLTKDNMDALQKFCDKQGIKVKAGKKFDLFKFLLEVSQKVMGLVPTAMSIERTVGGLVEKEGKDSENFGGSPCGGSVVTLDLDEDPYTGIKLSEDDGDDDDDDDEMMMTMIPMRMMTMMMMTMIPIRMMTMVTRTVMMIPIGMTNLIPMIPMTMMTMMTMTMIPIRMMTMMTMTMMNPNPRRARRARRKSPKPRRVNQLQPRRTLNGKNAARNLKPNFPSMPKSPSVC